MSTTSAPATFENTVANTVAPPQLPPSRLASIDAYRGLVMVLMMAELLNLSKVARALPDSAFWQYLAAQQTHVQWIGCSLHDLIQPSFSFLVGVAVPFSLAARRARGQRLSTMWLHTLWRALALILLGVFLRSTHANSTNWTFEDTLTQIGLGYGFLFFLGLRPTRDQWLAFIAILVIYWAAFALYPLPKADFDYRSVQVSAEWRQQNSPTGLAAHWDKNTNPAWKFDTWFLNLFPREKPFVANSGGYATLSFIPTLATMILGLIAGGVIRDPRSPLHKIKWLLTFGVAALAGGWLIGAIGLCPVVKRIWTPSWVLFSGGWCLLFLAAFYCVVEVLQKRTWAFPLVVVGMNSIAAYLIAHLFEEFVQRSLTIHLGKSFFAFAGAPYEPLLRGAAVLPIFWLILYWMYKRKLFLKI